MEVKLIIGLFILLGSLDVIWADDDDGRIYVQERTDNLFHLYHNITEKMTFFAEDLLRILADSSTGCSILCASHSSILIHDKFEWKYPNKHSVNIIDSMAKLPNGILQGSLFWPGNYDQCINTRGHNVSGKYCLVQARYNGSETKQEMKIKAIIPQIIYELQNKYPLRVGVCVPSSCSTQDLLKALLTFFGSEDELSELTNSLQISVDENDCRTDAVTQYPTATIAIYTTLIFFITLLVFGTCLDYYRLHSTEAGLPYPKQKWKRYLEYFVESTFGPKSVGRWFLTSFSLINNLDKLLVSVDSDHIFRVVNSMQVLSIMWFISNRMFITAMPYFWHDLVNISEFQNTFLYVILINQLGAIDNVIFLRGFLIGYFRGLDEIALTNQQNNQQEQTRSKEYLKQIVTTIVFLVEHYLTITFPYIIFMIMIMGFSPILTGPSTHSFEKEIAACEYNWWTNILYISNFIPSSEMCLRHSWYPSMLMQLYVGTVILIQFRNWKIVQLVATLAVLMGCAAYVIHLLQMEEVTIGLFANFRQERGYDYIHELIHSKPYSRMYGYLIGVVYGYYFFYYEENKNTIGSTPNKLKKILQDYTICIFMAEILLAAVIFSFSAIAWHDFRGFGTLQNKFVEPTLVILWPIGLCVFLAYIQFNSIGFLRTILCLEFFQPLAKLAVPAFLFQYVVLQLFFRSRSDTISFDCVTLITLGFGVIVVVYSLAAVFHILFEAPIQKWTLSLLCRFERSGWASMNWVWYHDPYTERYPKRRTSEETIGRSRQLISRVSRFASIEIHEGEDKDSWEMELGSLVLERRTPESEATEVIDDLESSRDAQSSGAASLEPPTEWEWKESASYRVQKESTKASATTSRSTEHLQHLQVPVITPKRLRTPGDKKLVPYISLLQSEEPVPSTSGVSQQEMQAIPGTSRQSESRSQQEMQAIPGTSRQSELPKEDSGKSSSKKSPSRQKKSPSKQSRKSQRKS